jgi:hypothetical protein
MISAEFQTSLNNTYLRIKNSLRKKPRDYTWRKTQLEALKALLVENEEASPRSRELFYLKSNLP